jgi:hypothetical protein
MTSSMTSSTSSAKTGLDKKQAAKLITLSCNSWAARGNFAANEGKQTEKQNERHNLDIIYSLDLNA